MKSPFQSDLDDLAPNQIRAAEPRTADKRVCELLRVFEEIEEYEKRLSAHQYDAIMYQAMLACGFADEIDAWRALTRWNFLRLERQRSGCHEEEYG